MTKLKLGMLLISLTACTYSYTQTSQKLDIKSFVTRLYIHGLPYDEAKAYGKQAVPELLLLLKDPSLEEYWPNIVLALGFIGDESATKPLISFMENSRGEISIHKFRAILRVFQSLGHISQSGNKESLNLLKSYTDINTWKTRNLRYAYAQYRDEALSEVLARQAIVGLGISGKAEANQQLKKIRQNKNTRKDWSDNLDEAINLNERVKTQGPQKVFSTKSN